MAFDISSGTMAIAGQTEIKFHNGQYREVHREKNDTGAGDGKNYVPLFGVSRKVFSFSGRIKDNHPTIYAGAIISAVVTLTLSTGKTLTGTALISVITVGLPFSEGADTPISGTGVFTGAVTAA